MTHRVKEVHGVSLACGKTLRAIALNTPQDLRERRIAHAKALKPGITH